jgi:subtilase family serine protease
MQLFRVVRPLLGLVLPLFSLPLFAQGPTPRLGKGITDRARVVLSESRTPRVRSAQDLGPVSPDTGVPGITLVFQRSATQQAALEALLAAQQDPASSLYHRWLTPESFAARFGVAEEDIATTKGWLVSHGFHIDKVARSRDRITFSGTAAQVQAAFGAELHHYRAEGELHFAPASDLTLPAELASVTAAVLHLSDFRPKPNVKVMAGAHPDYTSSSAQAHYLTPNDVRTMYGVSSNNDTYGNGQSLAVVGQSFVNSSSIGNFQGNLTGYVPISSVLVPGSGVEAYSPGDESESELDLEYAAGIAPSANVFLVYVGDNQNYSVFDALTFAITEKIAPVISISYGVCEPMLSPSELDQYNAVFQEASSQGQTLVAAAGDDGSTACARFSSSQGVTAAEQQELSVDFPASSPNVTAVGGTQMAPGTFTAGDSPYWFSAGSTDTTNSLRSYVPEVVWNEGSPSHGIVAGGGGSSVHFPRPAWQSAYPGMPAGTNRLLPDIALQSSIASPGFILCTSDPAMLNAEGQTSGCFDGLLGSNNKLTLAGGTSFAAPIFAGFVALLNEAVNQAGSATGQGNINPELYSLAKSSSAVFHDITTGTNACVASATNCGSAGESSYAATAGYDEATGLGSINVSALTAVWPASNSAGLEPTGIFFLTTQTTAAAGGTVPIQAEVYSALGQPNGTVPTGSVSVSVDGTVVDSSVAFSQTFPGYPQAGAVYDFVAPAASGSHLVTVTYPGDATHASSSAVFPVTVGNVMASGGMTLSAGNLTVANGNTGSTKVTVTPTGGYNGRMVWSLSATVAAGNPSNLTACYAIPSLLVSGISTANLTIGTGSACESAAPATGAAFRTLSQHTLPKGKTRAHWSGTTTTGVYACALICGCLVGSRRKWRLSLLLVVLFFSLAGANLIGCGGGANNSTSPPPATPSATTYTVTLSGTDSVNTTITASTTFTLTVD